MMLWKNIKTLCGCMSICFLMQFAALSVSSCAIVSGPEEDLHQTELSMSAMMSPVTKSNLDFPEGGIFGVYAYASSEPGDTEWKPALATSELYLDNVKFICGRDSGGMPVAHGYESPYYWPGSGSLLLYGYSPHVDLSSCVRSVAHYPNVQSPTDANAYFAIDFRQSLSPKNMEELLWFDAKDVEGGLSLTKGGPVEVLFRRAHAKVTFNLSYTYYKKVSIRLTECIYRGIFYTGATPGWMPDSSKDAEGRYAYLTSYDMFDVKRGDSEKNFEQSVSMFMMPQYTDGYFEEVGLQLGGDMLLEITMVDGDMGTVTTVTKHLKDYTDRWEMGYHYTYNITVSPKPIEFGKPEITITTEPVTI